MIYNFLNYSYNLSLIEENYKALIDEYNSIKYNNQD